MHPSRARRAASRPRGRAARDAVGVRVVPVQLRRFASRAACPRQAREGAEEITWGLPPRRRAPTTTSHTRGVPRESACPQYRGVGIVQSDHDGRSGCRDGHRGAAATHRVGTSSRPRPPIMSAQRLPPLVAPPRCHASARHRHSQHRSPDGGRDVRILRSDDSSPLRRHQQRAERLLGVSHPVRPGASDPDPRRRAPRRVRYTPNPTADGPRPRPAHCGAARGDVGATDGAPPSRRPEQPVTERIAFALSTPAPPADRDRLTRRSPDRQRVGRVTPTLPAAAQLAHSRIADAAPRLFGSSGIDGSTERVPRRGVSATPCTVGPPSTQAR